MHEQVEKAVAVLQQGGVILYPTDTVYGLGCDALNVEAIECINYIKGRGQEKRMIILTSDIAMVERFVVMNSLERKLAEAYWPGPVTIELEHKPELPGILTGGIRRGGVRVPDHVFCREVVTALGRPITSTSANISGQPQAPTLEDILKDLRDKRDQIGLVIEEVSKPDILLPPSTLVKVEGEQIVVIREGAISKEAIHSRIFT